ncbi:MULTISPECIES: hypothetical protein [Actinosynnema]|uniref:hypothetical protein n=1 Tax=Actinosynnema TaxID=40566 RepID=UPI0020A2E6FE|nr:hypothetical protein [Actinosynnema pretiosum]MCP2097302.1 hypothetical protein [Actinosynnema pretiosum]
MNTPTIPLRPTHTDPDPAGRMGGARPTGDRDAELAALLRRATAQHRDGQGHRAATLTLAEAAALASGLGRAHLYLVRLTHACLENDLGRILVENGDKHLPLPLRELLVELTTCAGCPPRCSGCTQKTLRTKLIIAAATPTAPAGTTAGALS